MIFKERKILRRFDRMFWPHVGPEEPVLSRLDVIRIRHQIKNEPENGRPLLLIGQIVGAGPIEREIVLVVKNNQFMAYTARRNFSSDGIYKLRLKQENDRLFAQVSSKEEKINVQILGAVGQRNGEPTILADLAGSLINQFLKTNASSTA